jgi:hypothetical protein
MNGESTQRPVFLANDAREPGSMRVSSLFAQSVITSNRRVIREQRRGTRARQDAGPRLGVDVGQAAR